MSYQTNNPVPLYYNPAGQVVFDGKGDNFSRQIAGTLTNNRTYTLPDKSGTLAMLSDIPMGSLGGMQLLGTLLGANLNTTNDQQIVLSGGNKYIVKSIVIKNAKNGSGGNINLNTAADGEWYDSLGRTGIQVANTNNDFKSITTKNQFISDYTFSNVFSFSFISIDQVNDLISTLYFSLGTPQGVACTADIFVYGFIAF